MGQLVKLENCWLCRKSFSDEPPPKVALEVALDDEPRREITFRLVFESLDGNPVPICQQCAKYIMRNYTQELAQGGF